MAALRDGLHERLARRAIDVDERDPGALRAQMLHDRRADAAAAAGDEGHARFEARIRGGSDHGILPAWTISLCVPTPLVSCWLRRPAAPWRVTGSRAVRPLWTCCAHGRRGRATIPSRPRPFRSCPIRTGSVRAASRFRGAT